MRWELSHYFTLFCEYGKKNCIFAEIVVKGESYVIVLELMPNGNEYFLLTAYFLEEKYKARDKMMRKYKRKLPSLL